MRLWREKLPPVVDFAGGGVGGLGYTDREEFDMAGQWGESVAEAQVDGEVYREMCDRMLVMSDGWEAVLGRRVDVWFAQERHTTLTGWVSTRDLYNSRFDYVVTVDVDGLDSVDFGSLDAAQEWLEVTFAEELVR